jgi:hypothetical protein
MAKRILVNFEIDSAYLKRLKVATSIQSDSKLLAQALGLYAWAVDETKSNHKIVSIDKKAPFKMSHPCIKGI